MTFNIENSALLNWFQRQQTPPGWFDLLSIMIDGMAQNTSVQQSRPFLLQMGDKLALSYPLSPSETLNDLQNNINKHLSYFGWGCLDISSTETALIFRHQAFPVCYGQDEERQIRWCNSFGTIMEGVYTRWMLQQGGEAHVIVTRDSILSLSEIQFRYHNSQ